MKLTNKLKALGFVGLMSLAGCTTSPKSFNEQYGNWLFMQNTGKYIFMGYDTDKDDVEDLRLIYEIVGATSEILYLKLDQIARDKNRNGIFEDDEYEKVESKEIIEMDKSPNISA